MSSLRLVAGLLFLFFLECALSSTAILHSPDLSYLSSLAADLNSSRNASADPCVSFYDYACGGWIKQTPLPDSELSYSRSFSTITNRNRLILKKILESNVPDLSSFYKSCMDVSMIEFRGLSPLRYWYSLLEPDRILSKHDYVSAAGYLYRHLGMNLIFSFDVNTDPGEPTKQIITLSQSGLSLPLADYNDNTNKTILLQQHIQKMLELLGYSIRAAKQESQAIVKLETKIAKFTKQPVELRNPHGTYNPMNLSDLIQLAPSLFFPTFFQSLHLNIVTPIDKQNINVMVPQFFSNLSLLAEESNLQDLISHARWRLIRTLATELSQPFRKETWMFFSHLLAGSKSEEERWKQCVGKSNSLWSHLLDRYYLNMAFPFGSKSKAENLIRSIKDSFVRNLESLDWMTNKTKIEAAKKSKLVREYVGGSNKTIDYTKLHITPWSFFENVVQLKALAVNETLNKLNFPTDPFNDWQMTASTVNAYYEPTLNSINFPAGILQPPFFSWRYPEALNYGAIGVVIAHELVHGFDDEGRQYDGAGLLENWWDQQSIQAFDNRTQCLIKEYESITVNTTTFPQDHINGKLTLGENIADSSGLHIAYQAFQEFEKNNPSSPSSLPLLAPPLNSSSQLFFLSYALSWCNLIRPQRSHTLLRQDPHSPARARVDGTLRNSKEFANSFNCPVDSIMNPSTKCSLY